MTRPTDPKIEAWRKAREDRARAFDEEQKQYAEQRRRFNEEQDRFMYEEARKMQQRQLEDQRQRDIYFQQLQQEKERGRKK